MIHTEGISKIFPNGNQGLKNVSFSIDNGECVILMGHNGSGKSTLFRCLSGLEKPSEGKISVAGEPIADLNRKQLRQLRKRIGIVFQHFNLVPTLSVFQNVLFGALGRVPVAFHTFNLFASNDLRKEAMQCLDRVGLAHLAERRSDELSGGQKQRVAIARMLMQKPEVILADEPIASLDPKAGKEIMELLSDIAKERKLAVVIILHHIDLAFEYGDRILMLKEGQLVLDASSKKLERYELERFYDVESEFAKAKREGA
ncbi:phosphonate ABC transporter ATP-binding protein [Aciduricibacillus chroicocephali]|uniref:Phosphonate ABC transporter ATP-binding protein n=1 Tax=Aciduricibacillus chroicocephali TaxID=3054939 RepID=A0ABY9KUB6_9BACI|nr:phosphonate ABC transporter ATP-binding protein [Bacillaceae bacterium 44XB]